MTSITPGDAGTRWIEYEPVGSLKPHPDNPKGHALDALVAAVERFDYTEPVLVCERTGYIAAGHGRTEAIMRRLAAGDPPPDGVAVAADTGEWLVPVVHGWSSTDDDELRFYLFASNHLGPAGGWINDVLAPLLQDLAEAPAGLNGTGLTSDSLDALLAEVTQPDFQPVDPADQPRLDRKFHLVCNNCGAAVDPAAAERVEQ
jgi:hypothetical protein